MSNDNTTLADEIITIIQSEANNNPAPLPCTIRKIHTSDKLVDVRLEDGTVVKYCNCVGYPVLDADAVLCFLNGDTNRGVVLPDMWDTIKNLLEED